MDFTPIQQRLMEVLQDGELHNQWELFDCLQDSQASLENLRTHICLLRKKLKNRGQEIISNTSRGRLTEGIPQYQLVRLISSSYS